MLQRRDYMSAIDLLRSLNGVDTDSLEPLQRVLLTSDGTLTEILEAASLERIQLIKVSQQLTAANTHHPLLSGSKEPLLERIKLLRGTKSGKNYAYAESFIAIERLAPEFREKLVNSNIPLGRLWLEYRLETFKELRDMRCQSANELCSYFGCAGTSPLLVRAYQVFSATEPIIAITEYFPASYRTKNADEEEIVLGSGI